MQSSDQERQDQRKTCNMEDSTMTIEFLRARLLSERSVSRSARQRADELARRVAELEEQLRIVSVQRRRAEKATADVLAILENNGVSDISDEFDSSSDQDAPFGSNLDNVSTKEEEGFVSSKVRNKESEELSGSDDFSSVSGGSLSWKGRKSSSHSPEKYKESLVRRRNSFASIGFSSPKHRQGKSCRQIRRRESRLVAGELKPDDVKVDLPLNGLVNSSEVNTSHSEGGPDILPMHSEIPENKSSMKNLHSDALKDKRNVTAYCLDFHAYEGEKDMEKALEHQAQLIGRYEAMERAQREWEEKFRENNISSTPDSCDPGNHSDVTEERDEIKIQAQYVSGTPSSQVQEAEGDQISFSTELPKTQSDDTLPPSHVDMDQLQDHNCSSSHSPASLNPTSLGQTLIFPTAKGKHHQESLQSNNSPSHSSQQFAPAHGSPGDQAVQLFPSDMGSSSLREPSGNKNEKYALVPHETSGRFTNVLDALKEARLSLQQKINMIEGASGGKAIEPSVPGRKVGERVDIPVGCSGLFRVPTDFSAEASKVNFLGSGSQLSLVNYYPDAGVAPTSSSHILTTSYMNTQSSSSSNYQPVTSDRFFGSPYMDIRSSSSTVPTANASSGYLNDDQILTGRYAETGSRICTQKPSFDPYLEPGLPSSGLRSYPDFPSYSDLVPQMPVEEGFPVFRTARSVGIRPDQFPFYDNHFRPDAHRLEHHH